MQPTTQQTGLEVVKSKILMAITPATYQAVMQGIENITFTKETINQDYAPLKAARALLAEIEKVRKERTAPLVEQKRIEDLAAKNVSAPLQEILDRKVAEYTKLANEIKADRDREEKEKQRVTDLRGLIASFVLTYSQKIASATTDRELVDIERLINLETSRKERYAELLPDMKAACEPIRGLLSAQKERVREMVALESEATHAAENDDDEKAIELLEKKDDIVAQIELNRTLVQESAIETANAGGRFEVLLPDAPKAKRTSWDVELVDSAKALKEVPELVSVELDTVASKAFFKAKRILNEIPKDKEVTLHGIRYYEKITY